MNKVTPFLWFDNNAEDAAEFYLSVFPGAKKVGELRSAGVGPWPAGKIATITIDRLLEGGKPMACGWLTFKFGLCWQIVPEKIGEILKHPKAMAAMMKMVKFDIATLEAAAKG